MALIVEYHVIADQFPVASGVNFAAGAPLAITTDGKVTPALTSSTTVVGIAGDSKLAGQGLTTAPSALLGMGANGASSRFTENRVSDFYDETLASGKVTVYHGGGKFWISSDMISNASSVTVGQGLFVQTATLNSSLTSQAVNYGTYATAPYTATTFSLTTALVGMAVGVSQAYPSGVPGVMTDGLGTDFGAGNMTMGSYVPFILKI